MREALFGPLPPRAHCEGAGRDERHARGVLIPRRQAGISGAASELASFRTFWRDLSRWRAECKPGRKRATAQKKDHEAAASHPKSSDPLPPRCALFESEDASPV